MTALTLEGDLGTQVDIDVCAGCQVIWFDRHESLRLSPQATLQLFRLIADRKQVPLSPLRQPLACPRCDLPLLLTRDRQRNTRFTYWRCARDHGRLTTFFDLLREKDFVRPLSPQQLAELRATVKMLNCSNCGAPIDLVEASACAHYGTPISILDVAQIERTVEQLRAADQGSRAIDPTLSLRLEVEKQHVDALFKTLGADRADSGGFGLVELGFRAIWRWLT